MKTILLVDDEHIVLDALGQILHHFGYKVISRSDAESALAVIRERNNIDLILTDYRLSGMKGVEFISALKKTLPSTPVIILTGDCSVEVYIKALSLGVFECLYKPVSMKDLDRVLKSAFERSAAGSALPIS
jgi:DNA-binding NtrC family response regulator